MNRGYRNNKRKAKLEVIPGRGQVGLDVLPGKEQVGLDVLPGGGGEGGSTKNGERHTLKKSINCRRTWRSWSRDG